MKKLMAITLLGTVAAAGFSLPAEAAGKGKAFGYHANAPKIDSGLHLGFRSAPLPLAGGLPALALVAGALLAARRIKR